MRAKGEKHHDWKVAITINGLAGMRAWWRQFAFGALDSFSLRCDSQFTCFPLLGAWIIDNENSFHFSSGLGCFVVIRFTPKTLRLQAILWMWIISILAVYTAPAYVRSLSLQSSSFFTYIQYPCLSYLYIARISNFGTLPNRIGAPKENEVSTSYVRNDGEITGWRSENNWIRIHTTECSIRRHQQQQHQM